MNVLRRASTRKLLVAIVAVVVAATAAGIAVARGSSGPTAPRRSLADAIHHSLAGPGVAGVTARITFTNHLIPSGSISGGGSGSPLLTGASGRLWAGNGRVRLELESSAGDTEIGYANGLLTVYDVSSNTAFEIPMGRRTTTADRVEAGRHAPPSLAAITSMLDWLAQDASLSGAVAGDIGGQPSYTVRIAPRHDGGLLGALELGWDANHAIPLELAVYSHGDATPVLSLRVSSIGFGRVPASDLQVSLPAGVAVERVHPPAAHAGSGSTARHISGLAAVRAALPFSLAAPASLVGLPRRSVELVGSGGTPAALVIYGRGLGAVAVLEQHAGGSNTALAALPAVSIDGAPGRELATALGTLLQFQRNGVRTTVIGSVPAVSAEAAARQLAG